ncbi:MAG: type-4 uracil-DNA glycosylase [Thermoproteota archaeon]
MCIGSSRLDAFRQLAEEVSRCRKCSLSETRRNPVVGDGDINSTLVLIGEAPGYWEDIEGKPFVGSAGRLLNEILVEVGLSREKVYITNVVKCRPPRNRDPRSDEIKACRGYLDRQLDLIRPSVIVTLGRHSTAYILSKARLEPKPISEIQGKIFEVEFWGAKTYIIPSYHPAAALYNARLKIHIKKALFLVKDVINKQE